MVNPDAMPVTQAADKYKDRFSRCKYTREDKYTREEKKPDQTSNDDRKSPSDIYIFNGEDIKPKSEDGHMDDNILLQLFKDQDTAAGQHGGGPQNKFSKLEPQLLSQNSHAHPYKPEASWLEMSQLSKMELYPLAPPTPFGGRGNTYAGGPNINPPYHKITGELLESNRSDSSSTSGADSSPTHSQTSRYETNCRINDGQKEAIRLGKDEKIAKEAGIKFDVKQDIVNPPMDEFNDMLSKQDLSEEQLNICRDIRRRGKNKVAAQNCRKRKIEQIEELQIRLEDAKRRQYLLQKDHQKLISVYSAEANNLTMLTDTVLAHHNKSPEHYLVQVEGVDVKILPKSAVREKDRVPQPIENMRLNFHSEVEPSPRDRSMYSGVHGQPNNLEMDQCVRRGWE
eukprot:GFUD01025355.1.p1 GENE.GFUD01025355.1~~GFUD01025355.1.p1  ORF type:complete len:397 (+),score=117.00 GFUD01025355.1:167-1357(+)